MKSTRPLYVEEGSYTVTVSISETGESGTLITVGDSQSVNEPAIVGTSATLTAVNEGDAAAGGTTVATFTHANGVEAAGAFTATVDWGISGHGSDAATVTQNGDGSYTVKSTRPLYVEEGSYTVTVSISETGESGTLITVGDSQSVNEPAIVGTSATLTAVNEGDAAASGTTVATFTHANGVEAAGAFTATVDWGISGHGSDAATVTQNGDGSYTVKSTRPLYVEEGSYTVTVSISETGESGTLITVGDSQSVNEPAIVGTSATLTAVNEGDAAASGTTVATFTHANGVEAAGAFTATVDWGISGHGSDAATVTQNGDGSYTVKSTRPLYVEEGSYTVTVSISETGESGT